MKTGVFKSKTGVVNKKGNQRLTWFNEQGRRGNKRFRYFTSGVVGVGKGKDTPSFALVEKHNRGKGNLKLQKKNREGGFY